MGIGVIGTNAHCPVSHRKIQLAHKELNKQKISDFLEPLAVFLNSVKFRKTNC